MATVFLTASVRPLGLRPTKDSFPTGPTLRFRFPTRDALRPRKPCPITRVILLGSILR